ncbi:transmembrane protein 119-like [Solea senegalensis]|uniref:Transmembrane protein 119-like n=1 Tax=Solea senegalensis TaxID=28829 RepID=A0AAV6R685_SOLSE|nr:transmembrane protein 119b [Solea senegalensis]KAG7499517.1 transmembrane protein 119-like [Solea senegalensis]
MLPMALHQIGVCLVLCLSSSLATPQSLYSSIEGSADEEDLSSSASSMPTTSLFYEYHTTPVGHTHVETDFLSQVVNFLEENMLLILVTTSFTLLVFLAICGAIFMSRRRKVNAYYPSSFPTKMYVDHRDKTGGAKPFHEVPEKPSPKQESEPVDSHKQLQADIMRAAKGLRTPNKSADAAEGSENSQKVADRSPEDSLKPHGNILDQQLPRFPEEKAPCELSDNEAPTAGGGTEQIPPEQPRPEEDDSEQPQPDKDDSQAPLIGRSLRPSSLHIHNDSATLQLIEGEKTAF